jgi:site-specific recombinase XerC
MNDLVAADRAADWRRLKALVLDSVSSPITKRVYNLGLDEFFAWYGQEPRAGLTKATVSAWRVALEARGLGSVSINVRITVFRKLAVEAADNGLLAPELAAGIARVKGAKSIGVRMGNWLSLRQAQALLNAPDVTTKKGLRDRAMLAVLLGCGLRRSEVAALTLKHIQQRDNRYCIIDLVGKHGRVRTIPMPTWVKSEGGGGSALRGALRKANPVGWIGAGWHLATGLHVLSQHKKAFRHSVLVLVGCPSRHVITIRRFHLARSRSESSVRPKT